MIGCCKEDFLIDVFTKNKNNSTEKSIRNSYEDFVVVYDFVINRIYKGHRESRRTQ